MSTTIPTFQDVLRARQRIRPYLSPTPLHRYPALDALLGTAVYVKHENYQPIGVFKVRGGINLVSQMTPEERTRGLITASTGNHGQSIAYAAQMFGAKAYIAVPENANPGKVAAMRGMGAEVIFHGAVFDEARQHAEKLAEERGYRYVHVGNEPLIVAGVATYVLEMLETEPDIEYIFVPMGGGSGASGACIAAHAVNPNIKVIAVQSEAAPAGYLSWRDKKLCEAPNKTFAEGVATGVGFAMPQAILWEQLDDFKLVADDDIRWAMARMIDCAHTLAEGAGATPLAAAYQMREELRGKKVALVCSGGNTSLEHLRQAIA
ncbi:MAG TPA: threonine/serine dehydratase [Phototrophicaceae bacterium]|nr:threonine/serine dehydratase [Phototrophicaceae bacterium]